jgi:NADPH:quinone reductase-like Zn-dependent oxidoreductase
MRRVWMPRAGGPEVLEVREEPDPSPEAGFVRVRVGAAGVNFADLMARMGLYPDAPPFPFVAGYEVAGDVDAIGAGVDPSWMGAPVLAMTRFGGNSSVVCVPENQIVRRPPGMDAVTGASIPVVGLTAWMMLEEMGRVRAGDRVLVHSAGGGVGLAALDLCLARGAIAIGTASRSKHDILLERGFAALVDSRSANPEPELAAHGPFDLVLDAVGGDSWAMGLRLLRPGGRLVCFGMSSNADGDSRSLLTVVRNLWAVPWLATNPLSLINENKGVLGVNMGHMWDEHVRMTGWLRHLCEMWAAGTFRPVVHEAVPFDRAADAHRIIHDRKNLGKVVLVP